MRILLVGEDQEWAIERSYARALEEVGASVELFDWFASGAFRRMPLLNRRPAWPLIAKRANAALVRRCRESGYDAVVVFKGLLIDRSTVEAIRTVTGVVVCFNPDNPWKRTASTYSPTSHDAFPAWDAYLTWAPFLISQLYCAGCRRVALLRFAWDPHMHPHQPVRSDHEDSDIVFAANWSPHREQWLRYLRDLPITLFGPRWAAAARRHAASTIRVVPHMPYAGEYARVIARARVALNIMDPHNCPGTNMRTFEIPGVGGVTCSTYTEDLVDIFPHAAVSTFRTPEELRGRLEALLGDPDRRAEIRRESHAIAAQHTYADRARELLELLESLGASNA